MRALLQRVNRAQVSVGGERIAAIEAGLLVLAGFRGDETEAELGWMAAKCVNLRIFSDDAGKMNRSVLDVGGSALVVSQFTLYGDPDKGNRPSYIRAAGPELAIPRYERFCALMSERLDGRVATGRFGADMQVELVNDGPVTLWIEREAPL